MVIPLGFVLNMASSIRVSKSFLMDFYIMGPSLSPTYSFLPCWHIYSFRLFSGIKLAEVVVECSFTIGAGNKCLLKIESVCSKATSGSGHHHEFSVLYPSLNECHYCVLQQSSRRQECDRFWRNVLIHF